MMHNKNIYKKLCTATISLGLLFSIGQFAYAHNPNLYAAEKLAASNPTLENLTHLRSLYEIDIQQHYVKGENDEAKEAEQELQKTQAQIKSILEPAKHEDNLEYQIEAAEINAYKAQIIAFRDETSKNYALLAQRYDALAELANTLPKYSEKAIEYQIKAAEAKAKQADLTISESRRSNRTAEQYETLAQRYDALAELAQSNPTYSQNVLEYQIKAAKAKASQLDIIGWYYTPAEQYEALAQRWDALAELAQSNPTYSQNVLEYQVEATKARTTQLKAFIHESAWNNITIAQAVEQYEALAQRWDALAELANTLPKYSEQAIEYQIKAAEARTGQLDTSWPMTTAEQYEALAQCWDAVVESVKSRPAYSDKLLGYQRAAAQARAMQLEKIIPHNGRTPGNYETLAQLYEEISQSYNLDGQYANAAHYKLSPIRTRLSMVKLTEDFDEKRNAYERAIEYNDDAVTFAEASGWHHNSVVNFRIQAAKSRIKLAKTILEHESTLDNYNNWVQCWEELVQLFDGNDRDNLRIDAAEARIDAAKARAKRAQFIAKQHETVENYDMLMQCWNEVAELSEIFINEYPLHSFHQHEVVEEARHEAELAMDKRDFAAMIRQSTFLSIAALLGKK